MHPQVPQKPKPFTSSGWFIALLVGGTLVMTGACGIGMVALLVFGAASSYDDPHASYEPNGYDSYDDGYDPRAGYEPYVEPAVLGGYVAETPAVIHPYTGVRWSEESGYPMGRYEGIGWCASLAPAGRWRMPTRAEVESLVDPSATTRSVPLYEPFRGTSRGSYLWSGEEVPGRVGQPWIMNLANGHVFNGFGYDGVVRCVRD